MDEEIVVPISNNTPNAPSSSGISNKSYGFVVTDRFSGKSLSLSLRDICEPDGSDPKLTSLSCMAIYAAVNKQFNDMDATSISHIFLSSLYLISADDQLQHFLEFEEKYDQLFRFYLDLHPNAWVNHLTVLGLPSNIIIPRFMVGSLVTKHQLNSPIISDPTDQFFVTHNASGLIGACDRNQHLANSYLPNLGGQYLHSQDATPCLNLPKISKANPQAENSSSLVDRTCKPSNLSQSFGIRPPVKRHLQSDSPRG